MKMQGHTSARAAQLAASVAEDLKRLSVRAIAGKYRLAEQTVRKIARGELAAPAARCGGCGGNQLPGVCRVCRDRAALAALSAA